MATHGICKFCGEYGKLVKAHIAPRAMYQHDENLPLMIINLSKVEQPKRSQIGLWDNSILCAGCEGRLQYLDDAAKKILIDGRMSARSVKATVSVNGQAVGEEIALVFQNEDGAKLKLFALFVLWRAAVSSRRECAAVSIGFHKTRIKRMLRRGDARHPDVLPTILQYEADEALCGGIFFPMRTFVDGVEFWSFTCGGYTFLTKTDDAESSVCAPPLTLGSGPDVVALRTQLTKQRFGHQTVQALRKMDAAFGDPWGRLRKA